MEGPSDYLVPLTYFPVVGGGRFVDDYTDLRTGGGAHEHEATDILAPRGKGVVMPVAATVLSAGRRTGGSLGGNAVLLEWSLESELGECRLRMYMAHFEYVWAPSGVHLPAGTPIATVGDSGDAAGGPTHVHLALHYCYPRYHDPSAVSNWKPINPYPSLLDASGRLWLGEWLR